MPEKICKNCMHWRPNGGVLGYGYCCVNGMGYRKPTQTCKLMSEERQATGVKVKYAGKWYDALLVMNTIAGFKFAIEIEPNHFEWIVGPEEIKMEATEKDEE